MATHPRRRRRRRRSPLPVMLSIFILMLLVLGVSLYRSNRVLQTTRHDPVFTDLPAGFDGCKIVVLSDLHGAEFGEGNEDLLKAVAKQQPDLIAVTGDLIDEDTPDPKGYAEIMQELQPQLTELQQKQDLERLCQFYDAALEKLN